MKDINVKKTLIALATLQLINLSACSFSNVPHANTNFRNFLYNDKNLSHVDLNKVEYFPVDSGQNNFIVCNDTLMYDSEGYEVGKIREGTQISAISTNGFYTYAEYKDKKVYIPSYDLIFVPILDRFPYENISEDKMLSELAYVYKYDGSILSIKNKDDHCRSVASNGEYTLVLFDTGEEGYVLNSCLCTMVSKYGYIESGTKFYSDKGLTNNVTTSTYNYISFVQFKGQDYAYISSPNNNGYYININDVQIIDYLDDSIFYAYVNQDEPLYADKELTQQMSIINSFSSVCVYYNDGRVANIKNHDTGEYGFIDLSKLHILENSFIEVDLGEQRIFCYQDGFMVQSWGTRSGKDSTPSHEGVFDIDWKAEDFEFSSYPGSYAKHWIPYNEFGEGIHDLIGDDEQNYGNGAYHLYGSHGCIRVPASASSFIYENYDVGSLVLVHK